MLRKVSLGVMVMLAACGSARVYQRTAYSGILELEGDRNRAMEQAAEHMAVHCGPNNFTVVREGYEPVAVDPYAPAPSQPNVWRVHYQCNNMGGPQPMPATAPGHAPGQGGPPGS